MTNITTTPHSSTPIKIVAWVLSFAAGITLAITTFSLSAWTNPNIIPDPTPFTNQITETGGVFN